jgi:hypothetical protein
MTVSEKQKFIFVEVGSTGSTSIRNALRQYRDTRIEVIEDYYFSKDADNNPAHIAIWALKSGLSLDEYYKFAFFRNPWEVAVSKFFFHVGNDVVKSHRYPVSDRHYVHFSCEFNEWAQAPGFLDMHYESKTKTMWDMVAKGDQILVDDIYDFKNLYANWEIICKKIGIPHQKLINNKNPESNVVCGKKQKKHYSTYYNDKTIQIVREHFAREIEYFGYEFDDQR